MYRQDWRGKWSWERSFALTYFNRSFLGFLQYGQWERMQVLHHFLRLYPVTVVTVLVDLCGEKNNGGREKCPKIKFWNKTVFSVHLVYLWNILWLGHIIPVAILHSISSACLSSFSDCSAFIAFSEAPLLSFSWLLQPLYLPPWHQHIFSKSLVSWTSSSLNSIWHKSKISRGLRIFRQILHLLSGCIESKTYICCCL